ncbi:MAG: acyloxyacyl hydrolase [Gemmatimonadetes bacterium]|nr:acyloxyacyl hydrolase [Gemmatimonadota bacterium]
MPSLRARGRVAMNVKWARVPRTLAALVAVCVAAVSMAAPRAEAQESAPRAPQPQARGLEWSLTMTDGPAPFLDLSGTANYPVARATFVSLALRWERSIWRSGGLDLRFAPELVPFATLRGVVAGFGGGPCPITSSGPPDCGTMTVYRRDAQGAGVSPIGLRAEWTLARHVALVASTRTSVFLLDGRVPLAQFNVPTLLLDGSLGARIRIGERHALTAEWTRASIANGAFILDDRALKASGVRVGLATIDEAPWPTLARETRGAVSESWMVTAGTGQFSPIRGFDTDAQLSTVAWRWERIIAGSDRLALTAGFETLPLVLGRAGKVALPARARCSTGPCPVVDSYTTPVVGAGLAPIALRAQGRVSDRLQLWWDGAAGGVIFDRPYPIREANSLNFLLGAGAGFSLGLDDARALVLGYRFQHLSNGFTADRNPGVNYHALTAALAMRR